MNKPEMHNDGRIAIIGVACRMPGAQDAAQFWSNLCEGVQSFSTFTEEELLASGVEPDQIRSPHYVRSRGIIGNADHFDASFFGFTPRDAELLDPQQRVFLECAWHALEDAGYDSAQTDARIGVYGGIGTNWHLGNAARLPVVKKFASGASLVTSNDKDYLTTRVSFKLGLTGPSVNVQCACSTSLVAAVLGMNSLRDYQCDMVLVGGATIEIPEKKGYMYQEGGMESPDGKCRPFDAAAKGTVFSRGAGVVVLKRLADAVRDRDHVYGVILDGAVNNDGADKIGYTAPSVNGQVEVALEALARADISAETIAFVEAHGTATPLGDPIEVASLTQAFRHYTDRTQFCALGSVKGNIGHTDVASGIASLIKVAMALENRVLPASVNFDTPNPKIDFPSSPLFVNTEKRVLGGPDASVRALVSSFGVGGTNACMVMETPPPPPAPVERPVCNVVPLSARSESALDAQVARLKDHIEAHPDLDLGALAFTLQIGRKNLPCRRYYTFTGRDDLLAALARPPGSAQAVCHRDGRPLAFAFPGQGNQFVGMGALQYRHFPVFRDAVDTCCALLLPIVGLDLRELMFAEGDAVEAAAKRLNQTYITQPALFVISYAQARLWQSWGIEPQAMIGHSVGEYVAACLAGIFSLEDALMVVARRGKLIQDLPGGSMLAVLLPEKDVLALLPAEVEVAAANSPQLTVVAGPDAAIADLEQRLTAQKIMSRHLDTSHAFHSAMMEPAMPPLAEVFRSVPRHAAAIPIVSTLTGDWLTAAEADDPAYWVRHMRGTVRFADAMKTLLGSEEPYLILECGPGHSLASSAKAQLDRAEHYRVVGSQRAPTDLGTELDALMTGVGGLWAAGRPITWTAFYGNGVPGRIPLPGYPFERQKYALDFSQRDAAAAPNLDVRKDDPGTWFYQPTWKRTIGPHFADAPRVAKPETEASPETGADAPCWLVFEDAHGVGAEIDRRLKADGITVIRVTPGATFTLTAADATLRPGLRQDYDDLIGGLKAAGRRPTRVLHLWNFEAEPKPPTLALIEREQELAFFSPLYLEQTLAKHGVLDDLRLLVVASGVFSIAGEAVRAPGKALAVGPCRVLEKEFPMLRARFVDAAAGPGLADMLIDEADLDCLDTVVAYRAGHRFVESYDPVYLDAAQGLADTLKQGGTYLITGGLSGLGLFFARHIAATVTANLVLLQRSALPERARWADLLAGPEADSAIGERIRAIGELESLGATVLVVSADVADQTSMTAAVEAAKAAFGPITGVIHSAGMAGGGVIALKTEAMAAEVLDPKVTGTLVLESLFGEAELDFLLLFSSVTAVLGEAGRVDYCAANSFMDAMAHSWGQRRPGVVRSVNWAAWAELGMAARWEDVKARRQSSRLRPKRPAPGHWLHPFAADGQQEMYDVLLDPDQDWMTTGHQVFGVPTLVGTTFLELAHRFAEGKRTGAVPVVDNAYFLSPLMFAPGEDRRLRLFVQERDGRFKLSFKSQAIGGATEGMWHEHFMCELSLIEDRPRRQDLAALQARFDGPADETPFFLKVETGDGQSLLAFDGRWDSVRSLRSGDGEWLVRLELPADFAADLSECDFHPALTDVAMVAAIRQVTDEPYLPFGYKRVQLSAPYGTALWSHIRLNAPFQRGADTLAYDITILDDEGNELAAIERYTLRKVNATKMGPQPAAKPVKDVPVSSDIRPGEGLDCLNRILGHRFMPQVIVTTKDLDYQIEDDKPARKAEKKREQAEESVAQAPAYARAALSTPYLAPENEIEKAIAGIWQGILGINQIGVNDDFTELGGNSLLAVQTVASTADAFQFDLPIEAFYRNPTVRGLAEAVVELLVALAGTETLDDLISSLENEPSLA